MSSTNHYGKELPEEVCKAARWYVAYHRDR